MTDLIKKLEAWADSAEIMDPDNVNASFSAPFTGMKEMYALSKGIEHGFGVALDLLRPVIAAADELIGQDEVNAPRSQWERVIANLRAKLGDK